MKLTKSELEVRRQAGGGGRTGSRRSLHGGSDLPTRGFRSPYTGISVSLHGKTEFSAVTRNACPYQPPTNQQTSKPANQQTNHQLTKTKILVGTLPAGEVLRRGMGGVRVVGWAGPKRNITAHRARADPIGVSSSSGRDAERTRLVHGEVVEILSISGMCGATSRWRQHYPGSTASPCPSAAPRQDSGLQPCPTRSSPSSAQLRGRTTCTSRRPSMR